MKGSSIFLVLIAALVFQVNSQDLQKHRWENRLLLLLAEKPDHPLILAQQDLLNNISDDLKERKLLLYVITPNETLHGQPAALHKMSSSEKLYDKYKASKSSFEVLLIGLDGGVKLRQNRPVTSQTLFSLIDGMPMRRAEINRRRRSN